MSSIPPIDHEAGRERGRRPELRMVSGEATELEATGTIACFVAGTLVATPDGERPVESLEIGGMVTTASGRVREIRWIGRRCYSADAVTRRPELQPVVFAAGSLGGGRPVRELRVSPNHLMLLDEVLVAAERLVDGGGITRGGAREELHYVHVELASHDVLLADGASAESYVDCDTRPMFENADEHRALYPAGDGAVWVFCAPVIGPGERLDSIRTMLAEHAATPETSPARFSADDVVGYLDVARHDVVSGWVVDPTRLEEMITVEILVDGLVVGRTQARHHRADVKRAGFGDGRAGYIFDLKTPLSPFETHEIAVRIAGTTIELENSPRVLERIEEVDEATVEGFARAIEATASAGGDSDHALRTLVSAADRLRQAVRRRTLPDRFATGGLRLALVIDDKRPDPRRDAGSQAIVSHVNSLASLGFFVVFVPVDLSEGPCDALRIPNVEVVSQADFRSVENVLRHFAGGAALVYIHRLSNMARYGELVRLHCPGAALIYNVADLHFLRIGRQAEIEQDDDLRADGRLTADRELRVAGRADVVITHSVHERSILAGMLPEAKIRVVPWEIDTHDRMPAFAERRGIAFLGGAAHRPNLDAVRVLLEEVAPRLRASGIDIPIVLVGEGLEAAFERRIFEGVTFAGAVDRLASVFDTVRLTVAPIRFGAGVKGKVVQSFAYGLPCVTTRIGAEGLELPETLAAATVTGSVDEMVAMILRLHEDEAANREASREAFAFAETRFSAHAVDEAMGAIVAETLGAAPDAAVA